MEAENTKTELTALEQFKNFAGDKLIKANIDVQDGLVAYKYYATPNTAPQILLFDDPDYKIHTKQQIPSPMPVCDKNFWSDGNENIHCCYDSNECTVLYGDEGVHIYVCTPW